MPRTEIIENWAELQALEPEWNALLARSRANSVFLTWEWIDAWREAAGEAVQPFVVTCRDDQGRLLAAAPFYLAGLRLLGCVPYRTLRILGDYHSGAEYGDWIVAQDREAELSLALARALAVVRHRWDCIWMPNVAGWTGARDRVRAACVGAGFRIQERPRPFSMAALPADYASYWQALSGNARSAIQRQARRIQAAGAQFEACASSAELAAFLDALVDLNYRRWSSVGQQGNFHRRPLELAFYRQFAPRAMQRGWLRLFGMRIGTELKAVQIGYVYGASFVQLQEGFDPAAPHGLGNVLRSRVIESCIREGVRTYDFLGGYTDHKRRWLATTRAGHDLLAGHRSLRNTLVHSVRFWPTGRFLRQQPLAALAARLEAHPGAGRLASERVVAGLDPPHIRGGQ